MGILLWVLGAGIFMHAQNTLVDSSRLELEYYQGQKMLFDANISLIAAYYEVDMAKADLIQARLWGNPRFVWNADLYSVSTNTYMNNTLQRLVQVEYIFSIGGKHTNSVKLQKLGVEMAEFQFIDFVRGLVFEYSTSYNNLKALRDKASLFDLVLKDFSHLIELSEKQYDLGLISFNELVRLRSEMISIETEYATILASIEEEQKNMRVLLNLPYNKVIYPSERLYFGDISPGFNDMMESAKENRPDLKYAQKGVAYSQRNLKLQVSTAIPDVKVGYQPHDKGSNYQRPYAGIVLEWDVPFFNRNQGMIKRAKIEIDQSNMELNLTELKIETEVNEAFSQFYIYKDVIGGFSVDFMNNIEDLSKSAADNFSKKNISLLQYIDFQRTYIDTKILYIDNKTNYLDAISYINFVTGKELIK